MSVFRYRGCTARAVTVHDDTSGHRASREVVGPHSGPYITQARLLPAPVDMHGQPDTGWLGGGRGHPVRGMGGYEKVVAWSQRLVHPVHPQLGMPLEQDDPFVLGLVVEERLRLGTAQYPLDPDLPPARLEIKPQEFLEDLAGLWSYQVVEQVSGR